MLGAGAFGVARLARRAVQGDSILKADIRRTWDLVPGSSAKKVAVCSRSPGVHAVATLRFGQWLLRQRLLLRVPLEPLYQWQSYRVRTRWGIEIPRRVDIDEGLYIGHFGDIHVSAGAKIGKNCILSQGVTVGMSGTGEKKGCPELGDSVYISPGAKVFGKITVGDNVKIGANAVVHDDIPANSLVLLSPGYEVVPRKDVPAA
jgi:serine O-acetyltransferase